MINRDNELPPTRMLWNSRIRDLVLTSAIALLAALAFSFASYQVGIKYGQDFPAHIQWAQVLAEYGWVNLPHYTFQQLVVITRAIIPFGSADLLKNGLSAWLAARSYTIAAMLVISIFYGLTAIIIYKRYKTAFNNSSSKYMSGLAFLFTMSLMLVAPISLFTLANHRLYLGYIGINVYHNPTVIMLKPLALLLFWGLVEDSARTDKHSNAFWLAMLTIFSTLTKPNYSICLLPVMLLWIIFRYWKKRPIQVNTLVLGFILPACIILGYQYWYGFLNSGNGQIVFAPLKEMKYYAPNGLGWMFLFSILFPLCLLILQFRRVRLNKELLLAWGIFITGATMTYLLAEEGARSYNLNFQWGAQVGLFILFIQSSLFLIDQLKSKGEDGSPVIPKWQTILLGSVLGLHLISGIIWYFAEVIQPHQWWF